MKFSICRLTYSVKIGVPLPKIHIESWRDSTDAYLIPPPPPLPAPLHSTQLLRGHLPPSFPSEHPDAPDHICLGVAEKLFSLVKLKQCQNYSGILFRHLRAKLQKHRNKYMMS